MKLSEYNLKLINKENKYVFAKKELKAKNIFSKKKRYNISNSQCQFKIELSNTVSKLDTSLRSLNEIKKIYINIRNLIKEDSDESRYYNSKQKHDLLQKNINDLNSLINETEIDNNKIFLKELKLALEMKAVKKWPYKVAINFDHFLEKANLDIENIETDFDKQLQQLRKISNSLQWLEQIAFDIEQHVKNLNEEIEIFMKYGRELTLFHLGYDLDECNLKRQKVIKKTIFSKKSELSTVQANLNLHRVFNLLP